MTTRRLAKVPLFGSTSKACVVDLDATEGAIVGTNLRWPDGSLVTRAQLTGSATSTSSGLTTTDDLDEGKYRFYFTNRRAQDAVGGIVGNSANVTLAYTGGTSLIADLTDLANSGAGALLALTRDGKGRITGTRAATITGTAGRITVANGDASAGLPTIDLATVADAGGGALQKTAFDAYGRKTGTSAATTGDLTEGSNLYFTAARVLASVLSGLSTATSAVIAATDTVLGALGKLQAQITDNLLPPGYIDGLQMQWVSGTALTVTSGAAYIQGSGKVLRAASAIAKTGLSLTASTWYHVYLYDNAGTPSVEVVTTAPSSPYNGTARSKTGDSSRRYVGSVLTGASGAIYKFRHLGASVEYLENVSVAPFTVAAGMTATTPTNVSCAGVVPITGFRVRLHTDNNSQQQIIFGNSDCGFTLSTSAWLHLTSALPSSFTERLVVQLPLDSSQAFQYMYASAPSSTAAFRVLAYDFER